MKQIRITKPRRRVTEPPEPLPMDPRDPEIVRAKQLAARRVSYVGPMGGRG